MASEAEPDAYGRTGEQSECWTCIGSGMEWGETCVVCGGYGWVRDDARAATMGGSDD